MTRIQKSHKCQNDIWCTDDAEKDKYGNFKTYCSEGCMKIGRKLKFSDLYLKKDTDAITKKREATVTAKHGVTNVSKTKAVKDKLKITTKATAATRKTKTTETNLANWGVKSTNSLQSVKDKKKATFQKKYGVDHQLQIPSVSAVVSQKNSDNAEERLAEAKQTKLKKYGDENYNNRDKYKETCIEKFGVENPSQNAAVHEKQMQPRCVIYTWPSGNISTVMGYEPQALDELLKLFHENDLITDKGCMPELWYYENTRRRYYPDIYIPKENLFIEVKSEWTYRGNPEWLATNLLKKQSCIDAGYIYMLMLYNNPGTKLLTDIRW